MRQQFDAIVIGAGEAGTVVAGRAIDAGARVALIYRPPYGSTCINTGCVPSKFLIQRARIAHQCRTADRYHIAVPEPTVDLQSIVREKQRLVEHHRADAFARAQQAKALSLFEGEAVFTGRRTVRVNGHRISGDKLFIATGMRPRLPDVPGLDPGVALTNETVMDLTEIPSHLIVIGGGYIGCELAQSFSRFGARVTMIHRRDRLLAREDPAVSEVIQRVLTVEGITLHLDTELIGAAHANGSVTVTARDRRGRTTAVTGSHLLVAAGRVPNTDALDLDGAGVETNDAGYVVVNEELETAVPGIWAVGDVNGKQPFTRICQEEGKIAFANAFEDVHVRIDRRPLGHAVFTDPQVGAVGLTEPEAREAGYDVVTGTVEFSQVSMARLTGDTEGIIKLIADRRTRQILGCHIAGPDAANLIYDAMLLIRHRGTLDALAATVGIFPTLQEGVEGTARALLRNIVSEEETRPAAAAAR